MNRADDVCRLCGNPRVRHTARPRTLDWVDCPVGGTAVGRDNFDPAPVIDPAAAGCGPEHAAGHPEYLKLLDEMRELHVRKAADYGRGVDPLANCRGSAEFGIPPWVGTMVRAMDKVHRIKSFVANGSLENESVEDSLMDLAAYALIAIVLFREERAG